MKITASKPTVTTCANFQPIGVFDSGIGGLSILRTLIQDRPQQAFVYIADTAYAPYGEQDDAYINVRSRRIAGWLYDQAKTSGLVIACNTATAVAAKNLRTEFGKQWPIIGVEPGLKPAAEISASGRIGIMATAATLNSAKFQTLMRRVHDNQAIALQLFLCACNGLAQAIELGQTQEITRLIQKYTEKLIANAVDVVVLGCTHYPLVREQIAEALPATTQLVDTAAAIARQVNRLIPQANNTTAFNPNNPRLHAYTTGAVSQLQNALNQWLPGVPAHVASIDL